MLPIAYCSANASPQPPNAASKAEADAVVAAGGTAGDAVVAVSGTAPPNAASNAD